MIIIKYTIRINDSKDHVIFKGKPISLPMKSDSIVKKCIELFSDPDPCIIHQSYASQKLADYFISLFPDLPLYNLPLSDYSKKIDFINIPNIGKYFLTIEVK